jgi:carbon monoxide dehydrogenase subunit G
VPPEPSAEERVRLARSFDLPVPADHAFAVLTDAEQVVDVVPGATLRSWDGETFVATVRLGMGPLPLVGHGTGRLVVRDARARRTVVQVARRDGVPVGTVTITVTPDGAGSSVVAVHADLLAPRAGSRVGRALVTDVGHRMFRLASAELAARLGGRPASAADAADGSPTRRLPHVARAPRLVLPAVAGAATVTAGVTLAVVRRVLGHPRR